MSETAVEPVACAASALAQEELTAWLGLLQARDELRRALALRLLAEHAISLTALEALRLLAEAPDTRLPVTRLGEVIGVSQSQASRLSSELEGRGLVQRLSCPSDSRKVHVFLTANGRAALEAAQRTYADELRERLFGRLTADEIAALGAVWRKVLPGGLRGSCAGD